MGVILAGDCVEVMATLEPNSVSAIVTDPPYGLEFMGKDWDSFRVDEAKTTRWRGERAGAQGEVHRDASSRPGGARVGFGGKRPVTNRCTGCGKRGAFRNDHPCVEGASWITEPVDPNAAPPSMLAFQEWTRRWAAEALRIAKPGAHILSFGGTRTFHRMAAGLEDAGWEIRDCLVWGYATGFPKSLDVSKQFDKLAGATREVIGHAPSGLDRGSGTSVQFRGAGRDETGLVPITAPATELAREWSGWGTALKPAWEPIVLARKPLTGSVASNVREYGTGAINIDGTRIGDTDPDSTELGRWPANVALTDPIFGRELNRFFLVPKPARGEREPGVRGQIPVRELRTMGDGAGEWSKHGPGAIQRENSHPTVKPVNLMRHLVRLVTPPRGTVLDPFLGSGTTALAATREGFDWIGIERDPEYVAIAEARLVGTQIGLGLEDVG